MISVPMLQQERRAVPGEVGWPVKTSAQPPGIPLWCSLKAGRAWSVPRLKLIHQLVELNLFCAERSSQIGAYHATTACTDSSTSGLPSERSVSSGTLGEVPTSAAR